MRHVVFDLGLGLSRRWDQTVSGFGDTVADCSMSISEVEVQGLDLGLREGNWAHYV